MGELENRLSELLRKDTWTDEERKWLLGYLETSDARELEDLMQKQFDNDGLPDDGSQKQLHPDLSEQMLYSIHERVGIESGRQKASVIRVWTRRLAIAASVILVIGLAWMFFVKDKQERAITSNLTKKTDNIVFVLRHEVNTSGKEKRIQLPDGSMIVLANKSEITFRQPFNTERDITLIGKAYFKVAKDKTKPFTVFSGDISTTALGTEFTVTTFKKNNQIIVRLYEGKVVVKAVNKSNKKLKKDIYLLAGQSFVYNSQIPAKVKELKIDGIFAPEKIIKQELSFDDPSLPEKIESSYFMFNNQPLAEVFDNLSALYSANIIYDKKDVESLYLIGKYNRTDSLETILKRIATVNNLKVTKENDAFIISK